MDKPPSTKFFDVVRFVFLTSFLFYVSLLLLDYYLINSDRGISFLLFNINGEKHVHMPQPTIFSFNSSETSNYTSQNDGTILVSNISSYNIENHTDTIVPAPHDSSIRDNVQLVTNPPTKNLDSNCSGQYIYVYDLPTRFNVDLLKDCHSLTNWIDMCPYMSNFGLGTKVIEKSKEKVLLNDSWYETNQFSLDVIFHNIMKNYKCLTNDSSLASAIYVPYYAGLDVGKYLWKCNISMRDASPKELVKFLGQQPEWKRMWGRDHFMVGGRIGWDFRRNTDNDSDWGTKLMFLPEASNMSFLPIESGSYDNDYPIPYPTYFHPSKDIEIFEWQEKMRKVKRPYLFSFAGAPRPNATYSIRSELIKHCESSSTCKLLRCQHGATNICHDPVHVMNVFQSSVFCLQPPGDSYTRRSTFDSILAGCIPVFFHPKSAYKQYLWHFPRNGSSYSMFIPEEDVKSKRVMINETLARVSESEVLAMREEIIRLIPTISYRDPSSRLETFEDAFDIAVKGVLGVIEAIRKEITNVKHTNSYSAGNK